MAGLNLTQGLYAIIGFTILLVLGKMYYMSEEIDKLTNELATERAAGVVCVTSKVTLESAIKDQNIELEKLRVENSEAKAELDAWRNMPEKVKYKWRTKIVYENNATECDKLKAIVDGYIGIKP